MIKTLLAAVAVLALAAPSYAQAPAAAMSAKTTTASTKTTTTTTATKTKGPAKTEAKTPEGKACSAQADAKNLHGKARKDFRAKCKAAAAPAAAPKN